MIYGTVHNSITKAGIPEVVVVASAPLKAIEVTETDSNGRYAFTGLVVDSVDISFSHIEYDSEGSTLRGQGPGTSADAVLVPVGISVPPKPSADSGATKVVIDWEPGNPEFNVKGYRVWRTEVVGVDNTEKSSKAAKSSVSPYRSVPRMT